MNTREYKYLRVRDNADFKTDIKELIKSLEVQLKINIKFLPQWKELIEVMNIRQTDYKRKLQRAENRKAEIIHKLFIQFYRASPFELTDKLSRTAEFWNDLSINLKKPKLDFKSQDLYVSDNYDSSVNQSYSEKSNVDLTAHPNTEVMQSEELMDIKSNKDIKQQIGIKSQEMFEIKSFGSPRLPAVIYTNQHKLISKSSIGSEYTALNYKQDINKKSDIDLPVIKDSIIFNQAKFIRCFPSTLIVKKCPLKEKSIKFSLTNCSTEYFHIRFKTISDSSAFQFFTIVPAIPIKLNPGLSRCYKFIYSLKEDCNNSVNGSLNFRVGRTFLNETFEENLCIPILNEFQQESVEVTETVNIPPAYAWQVTAKCGYPKGIVQICVKGDRPYNLHVRKKEFDFTQEYSTSVNSMVVVTPDTESLEDKVNDTDFEMQSNIITTPRATNAFEQITDDETVFTATDVVTFVLNVIVDLALESFIFKNTFLRLYPKSKRVIIVYFTKVEYIGYHHSYYNLIFTDPHSDEIIMNKIIKIFAEVLSHPIQIRPNILDMTKSPVTFGYCEDSIIVSNTHKFFTVLIKIKTTTKMNKIFQITPTQSSVLPKSEVSFKVKMCTCHLVQKFVDTLAHFTIQIFVVGHKSIYQNVPPFYYEIITPCSTEFRKNYGLNYFTYKTESTE